MSFIWKTRQIEFDTMLSFEHSLKIRYVECDPMQRAHHSNYLIWFEEGRVELLNYLNLPYEKLESSGYFIPVIEASIHYIKPTYFNDSLTICIQLKEKPKVRFSFDYTLKRNDQIVAEGTTKHAFINEKKAVIRPPECFQKAIQPFWPS